MPASDTIIKLSLTEKLFSKCLQGHFQYVYRCGHLVVRLEKPQGSHKSNRFCMDSNQEKQCKHKCTPYKLKI